MDATESHVFDHLAHRGYVDVIFEPDGNIPPDFLVDGVIAIEVRRLNKNYFNENGVKGLEEVSIPLVKKINTLLDNLGVPINDESWFVDFCFSRPVRHWKNLEPELRQALEEFKSSPAKQNAVFRTPGFKLKIFRASKIHSTMFVMGGFIDGDANGWELPDMQMNVNFCVDEKSKKVEKYQHKYQQWWLMLVNRIVHGLSKSDQDKLRKLVSIEHAWDKIIIIDPQDHKKWFEI
ncbi:hypothetical protein DSCW_51060 [Desulfosarcina widdelii]|uniref:Uncharacterized protein n=1 Tax=Desulfosarcina widdelii TaxID=947919 RepID=A0A5K7ZBZ4_9BACT|nr:hypothetical protein [Desulfosarcina widdelii]BBO77689.1 hypothetical protein DSCW_51060 [Desulfosarcina widdelii]